MKAYVVAAPGDPVRLHDVPRPAAAARHPRLPAAADLTADGKTFRAGESFVIPTDQPQRGSSRRCSRSEPTFADKVFYDISAWTMPLAFNLQHAELDRGAQRRRDGVRSRARIARRRSRLTFGKDDLGYLIDWRSATTRRACWAGCSPRTSRSAWPATPSRPVTARTRRRYGYGSLFVPLGIQPEKRDKVVELLRAAGGEGVRVQPLTDGLSLHGIKPGSAAFAAGAGRARRAGHRRGHQRLRIRRGVAPVRPAPRRAVDALDTHRLGSHRAGPLQRRRPGQRHLRRRHGGGRSSGCADMSKAAER